MEPTQTPHNDAPINQPERGNDHQNSPVDHAAGEPSRSDRDIFDERWRMFMELFGQRCTEAGATSAVAIVSDPQSPLPHVYCLGDPYDAARLTKMVHARLMEEVIRSLRV